MSKKKNHLLFQDPIEEETWPPTPTSPSPAAPPDPTPSEGPTPSATGTTVSMSSPILGKKKALDTRLDVALEKPVEVLSKVAESNDRYRTTYS